MNYKNKKPTVQNGIFGFAQHKLTLRKTKRAKIFPTHPDCE
jgi:hypothetical protein